MLLRKVIGKIELMNWRQSKIILATSGGLDSMTMAKLFLEAKNNFAKSPYGLAGFDFVIAHCNFNLRNEDSINDAKLVKQWALDNNIIYYSESFDTNAIIKEEGGNIQIVARQLRYNWLEQLRNTLQFDFIATAHHKQDSVETLLMNFFNGTGISGLHGILPEKNFLIRPLLDFDKTELLNYAVLKKVEWREDVSNEKTDYLRNKIRLQLLPNIECIFPQAIDTLYENTKKFSEIEQLYLQSIERYRKKLIEKRGQDFYIPLKKLIHCKPLSTITYELLKPFGLNASQLNEVVNLVTSHSGKYIDLNNNYRLIKNRNFFVITKKETTQTDLILITTNDQIIVHDQFELKAKIVNSLPPVPQISNNDLFIDLESISFPLLLRTRKEGDYLYPLGMNMKKKKVKKILIDLKIPIHEKEKVWVIENQKKIVGILGIRADERFKVKQTTKQILHLHFHKNEFNNA